MRLFRNFLLLLLFNASLAWAAPPSEASLKQLLAVTQARALIDGISPQIDAMIGKTMQDALKGATPTAAEQQAIDNLLVKIRALHKHELSWEAFEPMFMRLYSETLTQDEVDGMLDFYKTPAGQALIKKMPLLMQNMMVEMQTIMNRMMPRMQEIQREFAEELKAARKKKVKGSA